MRARRGFTLIELMVVIGVIALMATLAAPALGSLTGANAREAAGKLAGGMRYLFDTAALRHRTCRMALDLDARTFSAECARGGATIVKDPESADADAVTRRLAESKSEAAQTVAAANQFGAFEDKLVEKRALPGRARFGKVVVEGRRAADDGTAYVYFFPGGQAQRAYVPVVDGDNVYTVVLEPFTGRARVVVGAVEVRE